VLALAAIGSAAWYFGRKPAPPPSLKQRQLTNNSSDNVLIDGTISPDGKYVAFSDFNGMYLKLLATGETRTIPLPESLKGVAGVRWIMGPWFPDGSRFLANAHVGPQYSIWLMSILGEAPHKIRDDSIAQGISPDGQTVGFTRSHSSTDAPANGQFASQEIWLMGPNGEKPRLFFSSPDARTTIYGPLWSPDGKRLAYEVVRSADQQNKQEQILETRDLEGSSPTTVLSHPRLGGYVWLPDGRMIVAIADEDFQSDNLWQIEVDPKSGAPRGPLSQLTHWAGFSFADFNATVDGKQLAFLKYSGISNVYVGDFDQSRATLKPPRRLTVTDTSSGPTDWTADGKAVIIGSLQNGHSSVSKQALDRDSDEVLVQGAEGAEALAPRLSPDGKWVVYSEQEHLGAIPLRTMRVSVDGGSPELVVAGPTYNGVRCTRPPADFCLFAELSSDGHQFVFTAFDPVKGRGRELARYPTDPKINDNWNVSPDGKWLGLIHPRDTVIHFIPLAGGQAHDLTVEGWPGLDSIDFAPDSKGLFVCSATSGGATLLYIDPAGKAHALWQQKSSPQTWAIPSRDGRHLALMGQSQNANLWLLEDF
jgi:eukaryotic-like serine/threonine-protein kinase